MTKLATFLLLGSAAWIAALPAVAHQIWIEQAEAGDATVRFGEFGDNLREASPGLLDKFVKPTGTLLTGRENKPVDAAKGADGFALPFRAEAGASIVAEEAHYPLFKVTRDGKSGTGRYYPAARLVTAFDEQPARLPLDLVPAGKPGALKLVFKGEPRPKTKVTLVTASGWSKEETTDEKGLVFFDMPWQGPYVAEVSVEDRTPGEREGPAGRETFDGTSFVTTLFFRKPDGLPPLPAGPPATPNK